MELNFLGENLMSTRMINSRQRTMTQLVSSLLNLDISALQTSEIAQCREPLWELLNSRDTLAFNSVNEKAEPSHLRYCIERLLSCLSEEAQTALTRPVDNRILIEIE